MGNASNSIIGQRPLRPDTVDKVMGRANFGADLTLPGMLHGAGAAADAPRAVSV